MEVEPLRLSRLYQSKTRPLSQPNGNSREVGPSPDKDLEDATNLFDGARDGAKNAETNGGKEARKASSICFNSSSMEGSSVDSVRPDIFPLIFSLNRVKRVEVCEECLNFIVVDLF
jgi:hypothetical protein